MYSQTHTYIYIYIYTCFGIGVSMYVCTYACMYVCMYVCMHSVITYTFAALVIQQGHSGWVFALKGPSRIYQGLIHASYHDCSFQGAMTTLLPFSGGSSWLPSLVVGNRCPGDMCQVRHSLPLKLLDSRWALPALAGPLEALPKPGQL